MMLNNARDNTHARRWARTWEHMERLGIPVDHQSAEIWANRYDSARAENLLNALDALHAAHLPLEVISNVGYAITAAFKMGQEFDGRIDQCEPPR